MEAQAEMGSPRRWHSFRDDLVFPTKGLSACVQIKAPSMRDTNGIAIAAAFQVQPDIAIIFIAGNIFRAFTGRFQRRKNGVDIIEPER